MEPEQGVRSFSGVIGKSVAQESNFGETSKGVVSMRGRRCPTVPTIY